MRVNERWCPECCLWHPIEFFRPTHRDKNGSVTRYARICRYHEQTEKDKKKRTNRMYGKARKTLFRHARKAGYSLNEFLVKFGWDINQLANEFQRASVSSCYYCHEKYEEMGNGNSDLTLDQIDVEPKDNPKLRNWYPINFRICCSTCNQIKGTLTPVEWGIYCARVKVIKGTPHLPGMAVINYLKLTPLFKHLSILFLIALTSFFRRKAEN